MCAVRALTESGAPEVPVAGFFPCFLAWEDERTLFTPYVNLDFSLQALGWQRAISPAGRRACGRATLTDLPVSPSVGCRPGTHSSSFVVSTEPPNFCLPSAILTIRPFCGWLPMNARRPVAWIRRWAASPRPRQPSQLSPTAAHRRICPSVMMFP